MEPDANWLERAVKGKTITLELIFWNFRSAQNSFCQNLLAFWSRAVWICCKVSKIVSANLKFDQWQEKEKFNADKNLWMPHKKVTSFSIAYTDLISDASDRWGFPSTYAASLWLSCLLRVVIFHYFRGRGLFTLLIWNLSELQRIFLLAAVWIPCQYPSSIRTRELSTHSGRVNETSKV